MKIANGLKTSTISAGNAPPQMFDWIPNVPPIEKVL